MKIVHFSHCNLGSAEASTAHVMEFADRLAKNGHQVIVTAPDKGRYQARTPCKIKYFPYINAKGLRQPTAVLTGFIMLLRLRVARQVDCLYIRRLALDPMPGVFSWLTRTPLVVETNGQIEIHEHEVPFHFLWKRFWYPLLKLIERILFGAAHAVTADGEGRLNAFKTRYPLWKNKFHMIRSGGIDLEKFAPKDPLKWRKTRELPNDRRILVWVGTIFAWSGLEVLFEAAKTVVKDHPDVHFLMIGDGPDRPRMEQLVSKARLQDKFTFTGYIPTDRLYQWLSASDMALAPYTRLRLAREDFTSYKIFEYMALGLPVVCSFEKGGKSNISYVERFDLGQTVGPEDPDALARGISRALEREDYFTDDFKTRARETLVSLDLTWDALVLQVEALCRDAADKK